MTDHSAERHAVDIPVYEESKAKIPEPLQPLWFVSPLIPGVCRECIIEAANNSTKSSKGRDEFSFVYLSDFSCGENFQSSVLNGAAGKPSLL